MTAISLDYGFELCWMGEIPSERLLFHRSGPGPLVDFRFRLAESLAAPIDFPSLRQAIVPGDRIVLALDRNVPSSKEIIAELCDVITKVGISPDSILILHPASLTGARPTDPRELLPSIIREAVQWRIFDPTVRDAVGYLASTAAGERIYLAREILDADFVIPISRLGFDPVQGRRHVMSSFYPGYSNPEAFSKSLGQGHSELGPDDDRPLRQLISELTWLLGIQFGVQILPSARSGLAAGAIVGQPESLTQHGRKLLDRHWRIQSEQRGETVLMAIPSADENSTGWEQLGAALDAARSLVVNEGRIIVLSDIKAELSSGMKILQASRSAKAALKPIRNESPPDLVAASEIARAADWATVYLHSRLDAGLVEDLFMTPLEGESEVARLVSQCDGLIVFDGAQFVHAEICDS